MMVLPGDASSPFSDNNLNKSIVMIVTKFHFRLLLISVLTLGMIEAGALSDMGKGRAMSVIRAATAMGCFWSGTHDVSQSTA